MKTQSREPQPWVLYVFCGFIIRVDIRGPLEHSQIVRVMSFTATPLSTPDGVYYFYLKPK